jgi:hypothetical protein
MKKIEKMNNLDIGVTPKVLVPPFNDTPKYRPTEKFTNTTFYLYPKAFLEGLALASVFQSADLCTNAILAVIDEYADMVNNFTLSFQYTPIQNFNPMSPTLAVLKFVGVRIANCPVNCWNTVL